MKKFWKRVAVVPLDDGFTITLDDRPVRTPARVPLLVSSRPLADAIAAEWDAQATEIDPASMPMTGQVNAMIDLITPDAQAFASPIADYAVCDLLCYRDDRDNALQAEQAAVWNPILHWAEQRYGVEFVITQGVLPVDQPAETVAALRAAAFALPPAQLAPFAPLVTIGGSLVAALALVERAFDPEILWQAVALDDLYQERRWGADDEAQKMRAQRHRDWQNSVRYLSLI